MRCFIGVPVDHHVALALLDVRDRALAALGQPQVRPVPARNFHLTLAFLGTLAPDGRSALAGLLEALARQHRAFLQPLDQAHVFPSAQGRLWVAEGGQVPQAMRRLHAALVEGLVGLGLALEERALRPHITLLRGLLPAVHPPVVPLALAMPVTSLVLYESRSGPAGSEYRVLETASLPD